MPRELFITLMAANEVTRHDLGYGINVIGEEQDLRRSVDLDDEMKIVRELVRQNQCEIVDLQHRLDL